MKTMNRLMAAALFAGAAFTATSVWAFTSKGTLTTTASVQFTGAGTVAMSNEIRRVDNNAVATNIAWEGVTLPMSWKMAATYVLLRSTVTDSTGGIQIYTDNKNPAGGLLSYTGTGNAAGLVNQTVRTLTLPLAWSIRGSSNTPAAMSPGAGDPTFGAPGYTFGWFYFKDPGSDPTNRLNNGEVYATVKNAGGIHFGTLAGPVEGFAGSNVSTDYVYVQSNFVSAATSVSGVTYAGTIKLEAFTE